jgi:predicted glycosyltransferase
VRILVDLGHPAHVHLFKNAISVWKEHGHHVVIAARDKDIVLQLLDAYGFEYSIASRAKSGRLRLLLEMVTHDAQVFRLAKLHRSDILVGTSVAAAHVSRVTKARSVLFTEDDADVYPAFARLACPFADYVVTPSCVRGEYGRKHVRHNSLHELAYLHPNYFTPNPRILENLGVREGDRFFLLRFVGFSASHDVGERGFDTEARRELVRILSRAGRVFVTAEGPLLPDLAAYRVRIAPERIHDVLHYATMLIGDSQTMAVEAAVLGTPAVRCNTFARRCSVLDELEFDYGLMYSYLPIEWEALVDKVESLLDDQRLAERWCSKRQRLLEEKTDLTTWMVEFIEEVGS